MHMQNLNVLMILSNNYKIKMKNMKLETFYSHYQKNPIVIR